MYRTCLSSLGNYAPTSRRTELLFNTKTTFLTMLACKTKAEESASAPKVISLFTCGMGMDIGFEKAGFSTIYANDIAKFACDTIRRNKPGLHCDEGDITNIRSEQIMERAGVDGSEIDVVIGGPPCQSFSTAGKRRGLADSRGLAVRQYMRVIEDTRPEFFVFENVPGMVSAAKNHVPFYDRMSAQNRDLTHSQRRGSLFAEILGDFKSMRGYNVDWAMYNAADYGVPQKRKRVIIIGSRVIESSLVLEKIRRMAEFADPKDAERLGKRPWRTLRDALKGLNDSDKEHLDFPWWGKYLEHVPPGGCWVNLPDNLKKKAMGGAADSSDPRKKGRQGGRRGFYRRLSWDAPSSTLLASPSHLGSCICHPDELRPLTVMEYARIQGFPDDWRFVGSTSQKYSMIGQAIPVEMARIIAAAIKSYL